MIQSVAILGAGAVGSYVIWGLSGQKDLKLSVVAEGQRNQKLKEKGCRINGKIYYPEVLTSKQAHGVDLLIVCLKYNALENALDMISNIVSENTIVMSLMNGIDSEDIIASRIGEEHIVHSLIKVASHKEEDEYVFDAESTIGIVFGEPKRPKSVEEIENLFSKSLLHYRSTPYILEEIWSKFRLNVCNNLPQAILKAGVGCYADSEHMKFIQDGLRNELETIAKAKGIDMTKADPSATRGSAVPKSARYSTLQDLDAKRHTEIDMFSGVLIQMGTELHIPTPYNEYTYHMIKAMEEKNDGLFDYENQTTKTCAK